MSHLVFRGAEKMSADSHPAQEAQTPLWLTEGDSSSLFYLAQSLLFCRNMNGKGLLSGVGVMLLAQIGSILAGCGDGEPDAARHGYAASGGDAAAETAGTGASSGGDSSATSSGGGTGGHVIEHGLELCNIAILGGCKDGIVHGMYGWSCDPITVECDSGCRSAPLSIEEYYESNERIVREKIEAAYCEPTNVGGAAGSGSTP